MHPFKEELLKRGYRFISDTDTEVLVNLIEEVRKQDQSSLEDAVRTALNEVVGAYAIVVMDRKTLISLLQQERKSTGYWYWRK